MERRFQYYLPFTSNLYTVQGARSREHNNTMQNLNRAKSLLFIPEDVDASCSPLPPEIPITQRGFTILGFPIGPASFCEEVFLSRVAKVKTSLGFLQDMDDSQMETALLRSCLAFPKVVFPLRTCPPHYIHHALEEFDDGIRKSLEAILAGTVPAWSWLKASLPSCRGGLASGVLPSMPLLPSWAPGRRPSP